MGSLHLRKGASGLGKEGIAKDGMLKEVMSEGAFFHKFVLEL